MHMGKGPGKTEKDEIPCRVYHGPAYRLVVDLNDPEHAKFVIAGGNGGRVESKFCLNHYTAWLKGDYYTYTGAKAEGLMLKLYRLKPKIGIRKELSASSVKNDIYDAASGMKSNWEKNVPKQVSEIIKNDWDTVTNFASSEDHTMRIAGMKFPREGYNLK